MLRFIRNLFTSRTHRALDQLEQVVDQFEQLDRAYAVTLQRARDQQTMPFRDYCAKYGLDHDRMVADAYARLYPSR